MSPFPFPSLGNFTAHLCPGHGSDPSPCYSSFMHYNTPDWSQEPHHIVPARFTHGCMLWESLAPVLSSSGLSWGHPKCMRELAPNSIRPSAGPYNGQRLRGKGRRKHRADWLDLRRAEVLLVFCVTPENSLIFPGLTSVREGSKCFPPLRASGSRM